MDTTNFSETGSSTATSEPRIIATPGTCGGKPRIAGHRIKVSQIAIWHERLRMSPDEIASTYPTVTLSDVHYALAYYFDHRDKIDAEIAEDELFAEELRAKSPSLLAEKLRQKANGTGNSVSS